MWTLLLSLSLAETPCFDVPQADCLQEGVASSVWLNPGPPKRMGIAVEALIAVLGDDAGAHDTLSARVQGMIKDKDFAHFDLVKIYDMFGDVDRADAHLNALDKNSALYFQAQFGLLRAHDPGSIASFVQRVPKDMVFRDQVMMDAMRALLATGQLDQAETIARSFPAERPEKASMFGEPLTSDRALMHVIRWRLASGDRKGASKLAATLDEPEAAESLLRWSKSAKALPGELEQAPTEKYARITFLDKLAKDLIAAGQYDALPTVLEAVPVEKYSDPRRSIVTAHLLHLDRHGDLNAVKSAYGAYADGLCADAVYPLMIRLLTEKPSAERTAFARCILKDTGDFSAGYQKELALALLSRALR